MWNEVKELEIIFWFLNERIATSLNIITNWIMKNKGARIDIHKPLSTISVIPKSKETHQSDIVVHKIEN